MFTTGCASALTFSTVNRLRPRHLAPRQWILARITARNAQHSSLTAAAKFKAGFNNSFPLSIQHAARPNLNADFHQFAGTQAENRLVLTVGKFGIVDLFDTNKYVESGPLNERS